MERAPVQPPCIVGWATTTMMSKYEVERWEGKRSRAVHVLCELPALPHLRAHDVWAISMALLQLGFVMMSVAVLPPRTMWISMVWAAVRSHADFQGPGCHQGYTYLCGLVLWSYHSLGSVLMSVAHIITKSNVDACGLGCHLKTCWCLRVVLSWLHP